MKLTAAHLASIAGSTLALAQRANAASIIAGLDAHGDQAGLNLPHRLAQFVAQVAHESGRFVYDREVWGPTKAQERYDTRSDLGNTPAIDGDGYLFRGRSGIQLTGRTNYFKFLAWCQNAGLNPPNFVAQPDLVNTDPWEGLVPIWYWDAGNPDGRSLNRYADTGNAEMVTRRVNGGINGLADRLDLVTRASLVFLGLGPGDVKRFQVAKDLVPDGDAGPATRAALHKALLALSQPAAMEPPRPAPSVLDHLATIETAVAAIRAAI